MRDKKVEVLKSIPPLDPEHLVRGQSRGYREEPGVARDSQVAQKPGRLHSLRPPRRPQRARALRPLGAQAPMQAAIEPGMSFPLGDAGVKLSVFSKHARGAGPPVRSDRRTTRVVYP
jgi:hypothetical protein